MTLYDPPVPAARQWAASVLFLGVLGATSIFLWFSHELTLRDQLLGAAGIVALLWAIGALTQPRTAAMPGAFASAGNP